MMNTSFFAAGRRARFSRSVRQCGFSLIELMVAIGMALFLVAGLISTVVTLKGTFNAQDQMTQLQENQRFLLSVVGSTVHNAGYFVNIKTLARIDAFPASAATDNVTSDGYAYQAAQFMAGTNGSGGGSDTLDIRYQTADGDTLTNCQGGTNSTGTGAAISWSNSFYVNASNQLACRVSVNGAAVGAEMVLADQVSLMKIMYGVDTAGRGGVDTYMDAGAVTTANLWSKVLSVQLSLTFLDPINSKPGAPQNLPKPLVQTIALMNFQ